MATSEAWEQMIEAGASALEEAVRRKNEIIVTDPRTGGQKGQKRARFDLLPWRQLWEVAEHYGAGAEKYDDRNWERGYSWSLAFGALHRHLAAFWTGESRDPETGSHHLAAVVFHALALMFFEEVHPDLDDRPLPVRGAPEWPDLEAGERAPARSYECPDPGCEICGYFASARSADDGRPEVAAEVAVRRAGGQS